MKLDHPRRSQTSILIEGSHMIERVLGPHGFRFFLRGEGHSSGGTYAWGEFVREDRRLEFHFRHSLGMVSYHISFQTASHEAYMSELGVREMCRYPGFSDDPLAAFDDLAHDLGFAKDFSQGSGEVLIRAASKQGSAK